MGSVPQCAPVGSRIIAAIVLAVVAQRALERVDVVLRDDDRRFEDAAPAGPASRGTVSSAAAGP